MKQHNHTTKKYKTPFLTKGNYGFTLIEMSIVIVIIGLIAGGVLIGQDLIKSAAIRSQISQIDKFATAANTFRLKYGYLPGDMPSTHATAFGFARTTGCGSPFDSGCGNGNGVINGGDTGGETGVTITASYDGVGEPHLFWLDLQTAGLIGDYITPALNNNTLSYDVEKYLPKAKLGGNKFIYVWGNGVRISQYVPKNDGKLYFALAEVRAIAGVNTIPAVSPNGYQSIYLPTIKVIDAYMIDKKTDDGLPQSGSVIAAAPLAAVGCCITGKWVGNSERGSVWYANWGVGWGYPTNNATPASATTCYDNSNTGGQPQQYSMSQNSGNNENCAISFSY